MSNAVALTDATFKDSVASGVTLVDFWAEWCGPCRMLAPTLDQVAADFDGKAQVAKVNVDEAPSLAESFGVSSIPTLVVFKDGQEVERFVGVTGKDQLAQAMDKALA